MLEKDPSGFYVESSLGRQGQTWGQSLTASQVVITVAGLGVAVEAARHGESLDLFWMQNKQNPLVGLIWDVRERGIKNIRKMVATSWDREAGEYSKCETSRVLPEKRRTFCCNMRSVCMEFCSACWQLEEVVQFISIRWVPIKGGWKREVCDGELERKKLAFSDLRDRWTKPVVLRLEYTVELWGLLKSVFIKTQIAGGSLIQ